MPETTTYKGLTIPADAPTGQGGEIIINGLKGIADRVGTTNWTATTNPTVGNDNTQGYSVGSQWYNTVQNRYYTCVLAVTGAAIWRETVDFASARSNLVGQSSLIIQANTLTLSSVTTNTITGTSVGIISSVGNTTITTNGNLDIATGGVTNIVSNGLLVNSTTQYGSIELLSPSTNDVTGAIDALAVSDITIRTGDGGDAVNGFAGAAGTIAMYFGIPGTSTALGQAASGGLFLSQDGVPNTSQFAMFVPGGISLEVDGSSNFNWHGEAAANNFNFYATGDIPVSAPASMSFNKATGRLAFNIGSPETNVHIVNNEITTISAPSLIIDFSTATAAAASGVTLRKSRPSTANLSTNDVTNFVNFDARFNSSWGTISNIESVYTGSGTTQLGHLIFKTANSGAPAEILRLTNTSVIIGAGVTSTTELLLIRKDQNASTGMAIANTNAGTGAFASLILANGTDFGNDSARILVFGTGFTTSGRFRQDALLIESGGNLSGGLNIASTGLNTPIRFFISNAASNPMMILNSQNRVGINQPTPLATLHVQTPTTADVGCIIQATASQTADQLLVQNSSAVVGLKINKDNYLFIKKLAAPADGDLAVSELVFWLDDTPGSTKAMFKAKDSGGTVRTGSVALV